MPTKQQVRDAGIQNILDAPAVWAAYDAGAIVTPLAITDSNGIAVATSPTSGPDGWAIYVDTENDGSTTADNATVTDGLISRKVTSGAMQLAVANSDCAPQKHLQWVGTVKTDGTVDISPARQQRINGSILDILYPERALSDGLSLLYPFIFTADSEWQVVICAQVTNGYAVAGVYDENGNLTGILPCAQTLVAAGPTELVMFDVINVGATLPATLLAHLNVLHNGNLIVLDLGIPSIGDSDLDGFSDVVEASAGTNPLLACGIDAWPVDINNNTFSDTADLAFLTGNFGAAVPPAPARYNIAPDPPDGFIDTADIARMTGFFGKTCAPSCADDLDCDSVLDAADNCPNWPNPTQALPPWQVPANDPDCDGFSSAVEASVGTASLVHCGTDAWPTDINNNTFSDTADLAFLTGNFGAAVPPAPLRYNIAPDPVDGFIDTADIAKMTGFFGKTCS